MMPAVIDDANTAQAKELLQSLQAHVDDISKKVEFAEIRTRRVQGHAAVAARRRVASIRHELYEAHRLIDGLHRRFPAARPRRVAGPRSEFSRGVRHQGFEPRTHLLLHHLHGWTTRGRHLR